MSSYWHGVVVAAIAVAVVLWPVAYRMGVERGRRAWRGPR